MSYENHNISGDLAVGRDVNIGGDTTVAGKSKFKGAVKIDGILDAKHIKGAHKGLFTSEAELNEEFPAPRTGWNAIVLDAEDETKGLLYIAENGKWVVKSTAPQPFQFLVDSINAYASKRELADAKVELLKRITGTSENSNPSTDAFKFLGKFNDPNSAELKNALDDLHTTKAGDNIEGLWRATIGHGVLEIQAIAISYADDKWMQVLKSPYKYNESTGNFSLLGEMRYRVMYRMFENGAWGKWRDVEQENTDAIAAETTRAQAVEDGLLRELNNTRISFSVQEWQEGYYINSNTGGALPATSGPSAVTDYIKLGNVQSIEVQGRLGSLVATVAFYDKKRNFIGAKLAVDTAGHLFIPSTDFPSDAVYIRATGNNNSDDKLVGYASIGNVLEMIENASKFKSNILLTGASFADGSYNQWPELLSRKLGVSVYNKALSGSSILHTARLMYQGTLYSAEELENFDILMIMHVHNQDVYTSTELKDSYGDYENTTFFPVDWEYNDAANMSPAQAYDYVLKKYAADCYALKGNSNSKWHGQPMGKPVNVVCLTHWHDARTLFNDSIRLLKDKWGFALVELDKEIGFTKELLHPVTKEQVSLLYAVDTETVDGVVYGWHPDRTELNGEPPVIQQRIAEIVRDSLVCPHSENGIVAMRERVETNEQAIANEITRATIAETAAIEKGRALAKRDLFIAAGALYNDTDAPITRTSPWKESVQHLPGHYYLNGLGDITEAQMAKIYNRGLFNDNDKAPLGYGSHNPVRTNLCRKGMWNVQGINGTYFAYGTAAETLNLHITTANTMESTFNFGLASSDQFVGNATKLRIIDPRAIITTTTWSATAFEKCLKLEEVRINILKSNIIFKDSPALSKASVLYMIENAAATTAITITLHADAYARLAEDSEIIAALEAQPLVTLVSA